VPRNEISPKQAATTKQAFLEVLDRDRQPFVIWSDNGLEFAGVFSELLPQRGIIYSYTQAYHPQQDGKCEKFWQTLKRATEPQDVERLVEEYVNTPHSGFSRALDTNRGLE
jgi:transposase InsO family protein